MRALTGSEVLVANKLFATLDTTVRTLHPESVPRVLVSDTVGFIKNLPHGLVASFKSTLDEALDAGLLLHVIDASDPGFERQLEVTDKVLAEIDADTVPRLRIFNKIDHVGDAAAQAECEAALRAKYPDCVVMSARRPEEVAKLHLTIIAFFQQGLVEAELFLPWSAQQLRKDIYASCQVLEERADEDGAFFRLRGEAEAIEGLRGQFAQALARLGCGESKKRAFPAVDRRKCPDWASWRLGALQATGPRAAERQQRTGRHDQALSRSATQCPFNFPHGEAFDHGDLFDRRHNVTQLDAKVFSAALNSCRHLHSLESPVVIE